MRATDFPPLRQGLALGIASFTAVITALLGAAPAPGSPPPCSRASCIGNGTVSVLVTVPSNPLTPISPAVKSPPHRPMSEVGSSHRVTATAAAQASTLTVSEVNNPCSVGDGSAPKFSCVNPVARPAATGPAPVPPAAAPLVAPPPTFTAAQAAARAWSTQPFAAASPAIQPAGNVTLPGLATYFSASFPAAGLAPGEEATVTLLGHTITVRPTNVTYTYHFGDGTTLGPTSDPGGPYPSGNVRHTYRRAGSVSARIDTTFGGQYRDGSGAWQPIPGTTTVPGTPVQLTVRALQSRLVQ